MNIQIECLPEPCLMFGGRKTGFEPRRALPGAGPVDAGRVREQRLGLVGREEDVEAARRWLERLNHFAPAHEGNAARFRNWPGALKALGVRFSVDDRFVRVIDESRYVVATRPNAGAAGFDELLELFDAKIGGLFGDSRPDCIVVCLPTEIADLRTENPGLSAAERHALERLRAEEEDAQLWLFQPSPEELLAAEEL